MKKFEDGGQAYLRKLVNADKEIMDKLAAADASVYLRKVSSDPMAETVEFEITVSPDAKKGMRNILVKSRRGLSNPARFEISDTDEFVKPSLRDTARKRIKLPENWGKLGIRSWVNPLMYPGEGNEFFVDMPVVVNGQITEAKTDAYSFYARKGDTVVIDVWGRMQLPYISDAVPGWFQPVVRVTTQRSTVLRIATIFSIGPIRICLLKFRKAEFTARKFSTPFTGAARISFTECRFPRARL